MPEQRLPVRHTGHPYYSPLAIILLLNLTTKLLGVVFDQGLQWKERYRHRQAGAYVDIEQMALSLIIPNTSENDYAGPEGEMPQLLLKDGIKRKLESGQLPSIARSAKQDDRPRRQYRIRHLYTHFTRARYTGLHLNHSQATRHPADDGTCSWDRKCP
jgi:hypothetical protein